MLPANVNFGLVEGRFLVAVEDGVDPDDFPDGIPNQGSIVFNASIPYVIDATADPDPVVIHLAQVEGVLDSEGYLCKRAPNGTAGARGVRLVATDDPDLMVTDWTWNVTYKFTPVNNFQTTIEKHGIAVPMDGAVDLPTAVKVPASPGYGMPQAEAAVLRAEGAAVSSAEDAALAVAAADRAELVAGATDAGVAILLGDAGTETGALLEAGLAPKADIVAVDGALVLKADLTGGKVPDAQTPAGVTTSLNNLSAVKADKVTVENNLAFKADLVAGKVPVAQLPTDALVTDANVADVVNGAQTGPAIDARITTKATPLVQPIVADYIASQPAVVDAAAAAVNANPKIASIEAALPWRGVLPNGTDISTVRTPGIYTVPTTTAAGTMVNWPTIRTGVLKVWANSGGNATIQEVTAYVSTVLPTENYARGTLSSGNTSWSPWGTTEWNKGLANGTEANRTNVDEFITAGAWAVSSRTYVDGLPGSGTGTLEVLAWPGTGLSMQRFTERVSTSTFATWQRMSLSGVSRYTGVSWERLGGVSGGATVQILADGSDLQKIRSGAHLITSATSAATMLDIPVNAPGLLESWSTAGTARALQRLTLDTLDGIAVYERVTGLALSFPEWQLRPAGGGGGGGGGTVSADPVSDHASRVEYARSRRGGGVGVLGKAVVMIRFDHWLVKFRDVILPIMREFGLVGTLNVNYDNMNNVQNGGGSITWGHVQDWNQYDGIEIANHGSTHTNASTRESIFHEIVDGRRNLETAMPRVAVETWQEHGSAYLTASDIDGDIGLNLGREPKNFFESYAGKLILAEHAIIEGKCGGFFTNLTGHPQVGQSHMSIDQSTAAEAIGQVDTAKQFQRGVTLYVHPGLMDTVLVGGKAWDVTYNPNGSIVVTDPATSSTTPFADEAAYQSWATTNGHTVYMRTSYFRELCAYLAAQRDAGNILVMTAAGGGFADKSHSRRENLLVNPGFEATPASWWTGTSSWTITSPGDSVVLKAPASAGTLTQGMLLHSRFGWAMGATHELVVKVRSSSAASLTLRMEKLGDAATWQVEKVHAIPGDNTVREYRLNLTLPRDPSITQMSVKITGNNGLEIVGKPLLAAI